MVQEISDLPFGGTDCALPMVEALKHRWEIDVFVVYTDSETWAGRLHPSQALRRYREKMGIPAKLVVVGMASNGFSIADPEDAGPRPSPPDPWIPARRRPGGCRAPRDGTW